jgi:hypothetical protein
MYINLPYICFLFDQTQPYFKKVAKWSEEYGRCPYWSCRKHWISEKRPTSNTVGAHYNDSGFFLYILDPWHQCWQDRVKGSMYYSGTSLRPSGTLFIAREWVMAPQSQIELSSNILKAEQTFQDQLPKGPTHTTLSSWIQIIETSI